MLLFDAPRGSVTIINGMLTQWSVFVCTTVKGHEAATSIIPSVQNLLLAARSLGMGETITTLHPSVDKRVRAVLEIPDTAQVVYCLPLGYPKGSFGPSPASRSRR